MSDALQMTLTPECVLSSSCQPRDLFDVLSVAPGSGLVGILPVQSEFTMDRMVLEPALPAETIYTGWIDDDSDLEILHPVVVVVEEWTLNWDKLSRMTEINAGSSTDITDIDTEAGSDDFNKIWDDFVGNATTIADADRCDEYRPSSNMVQCTTDFKTGQTVGSHEKQDPDQHHANAQDIILIDLTGDTDDEEDCSLPAESIKDQRSIRRRFSTTKANGIIDWFEADRRFGSMAVQEKTLSKNSGVRKKRTKKKQIKARQRSEKNYMK